VRPASPGPRRRGEEAQAEASRTVSQLFLHGRQVSWLFYHVRLALRAGLMRQFVALESDALHRSTTLHCSSVPRLYASVPSNALVSVVFLPLSSVATNLRQLYPLQRVTSVVLCLLLVVNPQFLAGFARRQHDGVQPRTDGRPVWWLHASVVPANGREGAAH